MSHRSRILSGKRRKNEQELRIFTNPLLDACSIGSDYQAPATAFSLSPNSKWLIVRNNLHKIRSWAGPRRLSGIDPRIQDWYIFFQMRRELRRAKVDIQQIQSRTDFRPIKQFSLPIDTQRMQRVNVSHVQPNEVIYYPGSGPEPIVLQSLLYYFSKECDVPYSSIFRLFLTDICAIVSEDRERQNRVVVFRRLALLLAMVVFIFLALMLCTLILSTLKTMSNFEQIYRFDPDGGIEWRPPTTNTYESSLNLL